MPRFPKDDPIDSSTELLSDPYGYIVKRCRRFDSDVFEANLFMMPTLCMSGPEAAALFYDAERFQREGGAPEPVRATLFGKGALQSLDGEAHRLRKRLFLDITRPEAVRELAQRTAQEWRSMAGRLQAADGPVSLYDCAREVLARAVCAWAGVPLPEEDVAKRTDELSSLFEEAANTVHGHIRSRVERHRAESWLEELIERERAGTPTFGPGGPAQRIALEMPQEDGNRLPPDIAATEMLNLLRPTVAVAVYVALGAHALIKHPHYRSWLADDRQAHAFIDEVRRFYPFFPAVMARVRHEFDWKGYTFPEGRRVMLDLYGTNHDPRAWPSPEQFRPERFLERDPTAFDFIPQGGGDARAGHRCPGEGIAVALTRVSLAFLNDELEFGVPPQDLEIDLGHLPALPRDRLVIDRIRLRDEARR